MKRGTVFVMTHESNPQRKKMSMSIIALAITRSLGRRGLPVVRIHPNRMERGLSSRYCAKVEVSPDFYASEVDLLNFLLGLRHRYEGALVLIPASDDCAWFVAKYREPLSDVFEVVAPGWSVMENIIDKKLQYERAASLGIPVPETYFPSGIEDVKKLAPALTHYPYVIKPRVAHTWRRAEMGCVSQGKKGFAAADGEALVRRYETIARDDRNVMIQEVIGGSDERLFTFLSCFDERSRPLGYCIRKKVRQLPLDFGYCTLTVSCHDEVVREQSIRLLRGLGFQGISGVEWKLDPDSGVYKLIEVNPRAVNTTAIAAACGVDLPWIAVRDKLGAGAPPVTEWLDGVRWINAEQDFWAARELHRRGCLSLREWRQSLAGLKVDAIFAADDLRPFAGHFLSILQAQLVRLCQRKSASRSVPADVVARLPDSPA